LASFCTVTLTPSASRFAPPSVSVPAVTVTLPAAVPFSLESPVLVMAPVPRLALTVPPCSETVVAVSVCALAAGSSVPASVSVPTVSLAVA